MRTKILIVDDSTIDTMIISDMLKDCEILKARDGLIAMQLIEDTPDIDLIILDLNMPKMNGFQVLTALNTDPKYRKIKTIILTNSDEIDNEIKGLEMGALDYIRKPVSIASLRVRINIHLKLHEAQRIIEQDNEKLDALIIERTRELEVTRDITIHALVGLLEVRNLESSNHTVRTKKIMKLLCEHLQTKLEYKDLLVDDYINELVTTTPLHDIGKVGIPDSILLKPGKLTVEEFEIMKHHVNYGVNALKDELRSDEEVPSFIKTAIEIISTHHERYDGTGYPLGRSGESIPLPGRLMAIIDVYDALMNKRVYKPAYDHSFAMEYIQNERGKHFDPAIVESFFEIQDKILEVSKQYQQAPVKEYT